MAQRPSSTAIGRPVSWSAPESGGGGGTESISAQLTPRNETVTSYGHGQTISGGMFDGWKVYDPSGYITGFTDDGVCVTVTLNSGGTSAFTSYLALTNNVRIHHPATFVGDFDFAIKAGSPGGDYRRRIAPMAYSGTVGTDGQFRMVRMGNWSGTLAEFDANRVFRTSSDNTDGPTTVWADHCWVGIDRVAQLADNKHGGTAAEPVWTSISQDHKQPEGGAPNLGIMFYAGNHGDSFEIKEVRLSGFKYSADL